MACFIRARFALCSALFLLMSLIFKDIVYYASSTAATNAPNRKKYNLTVNFLWIMNDKVELWYEIESIANPASNI